MEIWKNIQSFNYSISNKGRVKSDKTGRILKPWAQSRLDKDSYLQIGLMREGIRHKFLIHRLVAQAFIENPDGKSQVNHKDLNRLNNLVENLEWVTASENVKHSNLNNTKNGPRKLFPMELILKAINYEGSQEEACEVFGIRRKSLIYWKNKLKI